MNKNKKILIVLVLALIVIIALVTFKRINQEAVEEPTVSPYLNSEIVIETFQGEKGWGYDVLIDGTRYIHQPNIPALPGDDGFDSEEDARKVADLMVYKIRNNILPPGVTEDEVKGLIAE